jgi:hypothetical protein
MAEVGREAILRCYLADDTPQLFKVSTQTMSRKTANFTGLNNGCSPV